MLLLGARFECVPAVNPPDVVEDGHTYYENALKKAIAFQKVYGVPVLADDSGLELDPLDGAPGVFSARFGGEKISWPDRWKHMYEKLAPFPRDRWTARFRAVLCYYDGKSVPVFFEGTTEGRIHPGPAGEKGFGYDPIFFSTALGRTFGEAPSADKDRVSHRAVAARKFLEWIAR